MTLAGLLRGALAGAAGTTALNAVTYLDMTVRGRPASSAPRQLVKTAAEAAHIDVPGTGETQENRIEGLAPLSGIGVGVMVGAVAGLIHHALLARGQRLPFVVGAVLVGAGAMTSSDVSLMVSGVSNPRSWSVADWISDVAPHLAYGAVTEASIRLSE